MTEMSQGTDRLVEDVPGHGHGVPAVVGKANPPDAVPHLGRADEVGDVAEELACDLLVAAPLGVQEPIPPRP